MIKDSKQRDSKIIELYKQNILTVEEIAKVYNISKSTVTRIIRMNNIPRRHGHETLQLTQAEKEKIIELYCEQNWPISKIQKYIKKDYYKIIGVLNEANINLLTTKAKILNPDFIENYFEEIGTPEKAYWLGWFISDGYIGNDGNTFTISLKKEDEYILHLLEKDLQVRGKVRFVNNYVRFSMGSQKLVKDLAKYSIITNKSFTVTLPNIDKELTCHMLRGLFDGDGGITFYKGNHFDKRVNKIRPTYHQELSFCGNLQVIEKVKQILEQNIINLKQKKIEKEASIFRIRYGSKKDIELIYNYLYQNCENHYLKRKKEKIELIISC